MPHPKHQKLLSSDEAFTTSLLSILIDDFGSEAFSWLPRTIIQELETEYRVNVHPSAIDRLMAGVHLVTSNTFYTSLPDFNDLCRVLSWEPVMPGVFTPADTSDCAWAITEAMLLAPPENDEEGFNEEIKAYIGALLSDEGIITPPDILKVAKINKELIQKVNYDYSDDPQLFSDIYKVEASKTEDINNYVKNRLRGLIAQLSSLNLKHGNVEDVAKLLMKVLPADKANDAMLI